MSRRRLVVIFCLTVFYLHLTASSIHSQKQLAPLPVKEALKTLNLSMFTPLDLSPDGKLVAYVLQDTNRKAQTKAPRSAQELERTGIPSRVDYCDIWISDTASGTSRNLTQGRGTSWAPVWSPNGKYLAFYSDRAGLPALWIWDRASGAIRKASSAIVRTRTETAVPRWTPDSRRLVIRVRSAALLDKPATEINTSDKEPGSTVVLFSSKTSSHTQNDFAANAADLAVVDLETKTTKYIASRLVTEGYWLSPDGASVAILNFKRRASNGNLQSLFDLVVVSLADGRPRTLVTDFPSDILIPVSWSPDGKFLSYMTAGPAVRNDCWVVPLNGSEPRKVTPGEHPRFDSTFLYRGPLWDATGNNLYLLSSSVVWRASLTGVPAEQIATIPGRTLRHIITSNGRTIWTPKPDTIIVVTRADESRDEGFYEINLKNRTTKKLLEQNKSYGFVPPLRITVSANQVVYTSQSASEPEDIWTTDATRFTAKRVTHINPAFDRYVMGEARLIEWRTLTGQIVHGALLLPAGYAPGQRYPTI
ncbi:MAG TPA: hypothetical protein VFD75_04200, partial [Pyrinomonadaceae bacterium]|nr:hypothetical protein [Pyrinomonadaceae bacterium]